MRLDLHFPSKLVLQSLLLYLGLEEDLQGHNEMVFLEPSQVHIAKFPLAQRTPDFKVIDGEKPPEQKEEVTTSQRLGELGTPKYLLPRFLIHSAPRPSTGSSMGENSILDSSAKAPLAQLALHPSESSFF